MSPEIASFSPGSALSTTLIIGSAAHNYVQRALINAAYDLPDMPTGMREFHVINQLDDRAPLVRNHVVGGVHPATSELYFAYSPLMRRFGSQAHPDEFLLRFSGQESRANQEVKLLGQDTYWRQANYTTAELDPAWDDIRQKLMREQELKLLLGSLTSFKAISREQAERDDTQPLSAMIPTATELARTAESAVMLDTISAYLDSPTLLTTIYFSAMEKLRPRADKAHELKYQFELTRRYDLCAADYVKAETKLKYSFERNSKCITPPPHKKRGQASKHLSWPARVVLSAQLFANGTNPAPDPRDAYALLQQEKLRYLHHPNDLAEDLAQAAQQFDRDED